MSHPECRFHVDATPKWECSRCNIKLCSACVPAGHSPQWGPRGAVCAFCNATLNHLGKSSSDIPPFWTQLAHFFTYPFSISTVVIIFGVAIVLGIAPVFGILGIIPLLLALSALVKFNFAVIEHRAHNEKSPPGLSSILEKDEDHLFLKMIAIFVVIAIFSVFVLGDRLFLQIAFWSFVTLAFPAQTIILALEKSFVSAINPITILAFISRIGLPYLLLWFCYGLVIGAPSLLTPLLEHILPESIAGFLSGFLSIYVYFVSSAMLGYVVYQYQGELGHMTFDDEDFEEDTGQFEAKRAVAESYMLVRDGKPDEARKLLRPILDKNPSDMDLYDRYYRLLALGNDSQALAGITDYMCETFISDNKTSRCLSYIDKTRELYPQYFPENPEVTFAIAEYLAMAGRSIDAAKLLQGFHKRYPKSVVCGKAYLLLAKLFFEKLNKTADASKLLVFVENKFKGREESSQARTYRRMMDAMA